jgi:hypothetical protein
MMENYAGSKEANAGDDPLDDARDIRLSVMHHS